MTVLPNGDVYACRRMESKVGNVLETSLYDLFTSAQMDVYRQFGRYEKCVKCELWGWCRGCAAVAQGYTGNHLAADPQCWKSIEE